MDSQSLDHADTSSRRAGLRQLAADVAVGDGCVAQLGVLDAFGQFGGVRLLDQARGSRSRSAPAAGAVSSGRALGWMWRPMTCGTPAPSGGPGSGPRCG